MFKLACDVDGCSNELEVEGVHGHLPGWTLLTQTVTVPDHAHRSGTGGLMPMYAEIYAEIRRHICPRHAAELPTFKKDTRAAHTLDGPLGAVRAALGGSEPLSEAEIERLAADAERDAAEADAAEGKVGMGG